MKRDLDYMIAVMKAAKEGKKIEGRHYGGDWWEVKHEPLWNWRDIDYRIKPEEQPEECDIYVPYESAEEFLQGQKEHGPLIYRRHEHFYCNISSVSQNGIIFTSDAKFYSFSNIHKFFTWQDGTPCGKLKESEL